MQETKTSRGFDWIDFKDSYGYPCRLSKSNAGEKDYIWLGIKGVPPKVFVPYGNPSWKDAEGVVRDGKTYLFSECNKVAGGEAILFEDSMHLSREQVAELLPYLQKFVETGELT